MTEHETLLPLEREYSDKEKIGLLHQQNENLIKQLMKGQEINKKLQKRIDHLELEIKNIAAKNKILTAESGGAFEQVKYDDFVKPKTHNRLIKRYQDLDKRFWEMYHELKDLKEQK